MISFDVSDEQRLIEHDIRTDRPTRCHLPPYRG
jgi:hypothetical protein